MPKARAVDGGHGVLTDHAIPRRASGERQPERPKALTTFRGFTATPREFGLAYAEVGDAAQASKLLRTITADAPAALALGQWEKALALDPNNVVALVNLGAQYAASGNMAEAERLWRDALRRNPAQIAAATNLITLLEATGRKQDARAIREQIERFEPRHGR